MSRINREARLLQLFEFLVAHPDGVTITEIADDQHLALSRAVDLVRYLRDLLGANDTINVTAEPQPEDPHARWLYRLVGNPSGAQWWMTNRIGDGERRIRTMTNVMASTARGVDGRSTEGRRARIMHRGLSRIVEDLDDLAETARGSLTT